MTQEEFTAKMTQATLCRCQAKAPRDVAYYAGFIRGLLRSYHGVGFGTDAEHALWLTLTNDENMVRQNRGEGYRDGLRGEARPEEAS